MNKTLISEIKNFINNNKDNVFTLSKFNNKKFDSYTYSSIKRTINQLKNEGYIQQILTGLYFKPKYIKSINRYSVANTDDVVKEIANKRKWSISITGERALNLLGLSTQESFIYVYASTGPYKEYKINNNKVVLKRCKANELVDMSFETKLLIQAIKTLGKENISTDVINILKNKFNNDIKLNILNESRSTTKWISDVIKEICLIV